MAVPRTRPSLLLILSLTLGLCALPSCDPSVTVVTPSDQHQYSLFGVMNVAADTQTIRVTPLLDSLESQPLQATVVLENLDTGEEVTFHNSVDTIADTRVYNAWAATPIQPATSYRLSVREDRHPITTATLTTPPAPPQVETGIIRPSCGGNTELLVVVRGIDHLAGTSLTYWIQPPADDGEMPPPYTSTLTHFENVSRNEDGFRVRIDYSTDLHLVNPEPYEDDCADEGDFARPYANLMVAAGGPDWPEWLNAPVNELGRPDAFSNVNGGHGYVGGIYPDTIRVPVSTPIAR